MTGRELKDDTEEVPNKKLCTEVEKQVSTPKIKKKHVALLLGYSGFDYYGMQMNCEFRTIEKELLQALCKSNAIPEKALTNLQEINFQRAARTDKNVSAVKQVVSFFIADGFCIDTINKHLPDDIRVFSIKRVTKRFNSKNFCSARTYSYTLPTFALGPEFHEEYPQNFRIDGDSIYKLNYYLQTFLGSNCFHNFTSKKSYYDPSARRFIMSFTSTPPFVENGEEFITLIVKGQSFMLHQIRKMVGHLIAILKGITSKETRENVWREEKCAVPLAPGLGLVLEDVHYELYNKKYGNDGIHEALIWEDIEDDLNSFKKEHILPIIFKKEIEEKSMFNWILKLKDHSYTIQDHNVESSANSNA